MNIPKTIYKIYINDRKGKMEKILKKDINLQKAINSFKIFNPNYEIKFFDKDACIQYIKTYYSDIELAVFNGFLPHAYKCDFFRYLLLYREGGVYSDMKMVCLKSLDDVIPLDCEFFTCTESDNALTNGFMAAIPKHPIFKKIINKIISHYKIKFYGKNCGDITGPHLLYKCYNKEKNTYFGKYIYMKNTLYDLNGHAFMLAKYLLNNKMIIQGETQHKGENNYKKIWRNNVVYLHYIKIKVNAICLLVVNPSTIICDFLKNIKTHHIYMIVDNNKYDLTEFKEKYFNINFIQIDDHVCSSEGFVNANTWGIKKTPTAWDKVFYYFGVKNVTYDNVWILEEDVFVRNNSAFKMLDNLYPEEDLLVSKNNKKTEDSKWLYWHFGEGKIDTPLYNSMVCACRISNKFFEKIKNYADENKTLFYIEIMINTIANKYKLNIRCPQELSTICPKPQSGKRYRVKLDNGKWDWVSSELPKNIKENYMYHPVKKLQLHRDWRKKI